MAVGAAFPTASRFLEAANAFIGQTIRDQTAVASDCAIPRRDIAKISISFRAVDGDVMVQLETFDIEFSNPEHVYFAGQEISGKIILILKEAKKINEILLELKGRARTYWTKHSGKSRKHCSDSEPYFCEQFNTNYTHRFGGASGDRSDPERIIPVGRHEVPFSYTLPKTLPSSFEGEFGCIRYTCKAICERPWDFDITSRRAFTIVGIEDINEDPRAKDPASVSDSNYNIRFCCRKQGTISVDLSVDRIGYTPGELIELTALIKNDSQKTLRNSCARIKQHVCYRAKTFAGHEHTKTANKVIAKREKGEIAPRSTFKWEHEKIALPSVPPKLTRCRIIDVTYSLELEVDPGIVVSLPIIVGTIPLLGEGILRSQLREKASCERELRHSRQTNGGNMKSPSSMGKSTLEESESIVQVMVTDESGQVVDDVNNEDEEIAAQLAARKRVRMPSSILSELYPTLPSPYYRESFFGAVEISEDKESVQYGEHRFAPKYPVYCD
uniref:Arrestin C-terminal-like domain-containing protein n=1 Tax=Plectus sambesii TaxID=2011161 RepID=A0A914XGF5_9BILA